MDKAYRKEDSRAKVFQIIRNYTFPRVNIRKIWRGNVEGKSKFSDFKPLGEHMAEKKKENTTYQAQKSKDGHSSVDLAWYPSAA